MPCRQFILGAKHLPQLPKLGFSYGKQYRGFPKIFKQNSYMIQQSTYGYISKGNEIRISVCSLWHYSQQPRYRDNLSVHQLTDKENIVCIHTGKYSAFNKKKILPFETTEMNVEGSNLSEISQKKTNIAQCHFHA